MITDIWFDDIIVIKGGKDHGSMRGDLRSADFHAPEWEIREIIAYSGIFTLWTEGMDVPQTIGGYGYSFSAPRSEESETEPKKRGKR